MIIPANPGWIIKWTDGEGPDVDHIIAWEIDPNPENDMKPIPITLSGRESNPGEYGQVIYEGGA